jgi:4-hydroxybenzoate polyprenyltransferase
MSVPTSKSVRKEAAVHSADMPRSFSSNSRLRSRKEISADRSKSYVGRACNSLNSSNSFFSRWYIYQKERFPLLAHGPLVLAFSLSALCFSTLLRGGQNWPAWPAIIVAFLNSLLFFLQLRLADEFKDFEEDSKFRPYRPVPSGLVKLNELGVLWAAIVAFQIVLTVWFHLQLLWFLAITWIYLLLMSKEFFCRTWLKAHPFTYMWTHMLIMPLIDLNATACDWSPAQGSAPPGLSWFVIVSFFNGFNLEIGRKIRVPEQEETGVETYSFLWGKRGAIRAWWLAMLLTTASGCVAARLIGFEYPFLVVFGIIFLTAMVAGIRYLRSSSQNAARFIQPLAAIFTLALYLMLGVIPLVIRLIWTH